MAEQDIIQNLIFQLGQSQDDRLSQELGIDFAPVDEQTPADLLSMTRTLAEGVNFYRNNLTLSVGDWSHFFPAAILEAPLEELLKREESNTTPHLALFLTFLKLYQQPQGVINNITLRHLDFYYQKVLQLTKKAAIADQVHLLLELKKNVAPVRIDPEQVFTAGLDATNVELRYAPTRETVINAAKVESLRSLFLDPAGRGTLRSAPIANSADGLGGKLEGNNLKWFGFGSPLLPAAPMGFAIASPVLRMREGKRKITLSLQLNPVDPAKLNNTTLNGAFDLLITGEKGWLGPYACSPQLSSGNLLTYELTVSEIEKAIIDYDPFIHGDYFAVQAPIIKVLLKAHHPNLGYFDFLPLTLETATVLVEVSDITTLQLESDGGTLDPQKAFLPFGTQPTKGSRFSIGYAEALTKKLSEITVTIQWKDTPIDFSTHYSDYGDTVTNSSFTAQVSFQDSGSWVNTGKQVSLFDDKNATNLRSFTFSPHNSPDASGAIKPIPGFLTFSLEKDFLQSTYRKKYIENILKYNKQTSLKPDLILLNEPYIPTIQSISLSYKAYSDTVNISSPAQGDFENSDLYFFHLTYFGQMREHRYQRQQIESQLHASLDSAVSLLPRYNHAGELLVGFSQLNADESVSVLFQVAAGSANPDLPSTDLQWFVLCNNYWKPLSRSEVVLDTTNQLLTSGIIQFIIPSEATTQNTILPRGFLWIKAAIQLNPTLDNPVTAVCQLIDVVANAIEVRFVDQGNDPQHLLTALAPGKVTQLQAGTSAIKAVKQPYASFGGRPLETDSIFYTRVSERLRHKNRCLTPWDYERIILEAFPNVHQVKCIPHAKENSWLAPGHVLIVVVPDLKNNNILNPLEPKVDADTLARITTCVQERAGMQVKIKVKNPHYQKIKLDFWVKFRLGYEVNYHKTILEQDIIKFLSPWAYQGDRDITFGGKIYKSVLLNFVEDLAYIDYVTDFKLYSFSGEITNNTDMNEVQPQTPDTILVSATTHLINLVIV